MDRVLVVEWFSSFKSCIHSDQGQNLKSSPIQQLCEMYGLVRSYHTAKNGQYKRFIRTMPSPVSRANVPEEGLDRVSSSAGHLL